MPKEGLERLQENRKIGFETQDASTAAEAASSICVPVTRTSDSPHSHLVYHPIVHDNDNE